MLQGDKKWVNDLRQQLAIALGQDRNEGERRGGGLRGPASRGIFKNQRNMAFPNVLEIGPEDNVKHFQRITVDAKKMGGLPCIRGLRIPVATVVGMVGDGMTEPEILKAYPDLELEDIREALRYAAEAVRERELPVAGGS